MAHIDLNSDLGESLGAWRMGDDEAMLGIVTCANGATRRASCARCAPPPSAA